MAIMSTPDIRALKSRVSLAGLIRQSSNLKQQGNEYFGLCPFHHEKTASFTVYRNDNQEERYYCHGCRAGGDHIDWITNFLGVPHEQAIEKLQRLAGDPQNAPDNGKQKSTWKAGIPPANEPPPAELWSKKHNRRLPVVGAWAYRDVTGALLGYVCRVELDGHKEIIPLQWDKCGKWRQHALEAPRPLYGLELLAVQPNAQVVVAEGEKAADAGRRLLAGTGLLVITWQGGCNAWEKTDWAPLVGRKVALWPDADTVGIAAMIKLADYLSSIGVSVRLIRPDSDWPPSHDFADLEQDDWTGKQTVSFLLGHIVGTDELRPVEAKPPHHIEEKTPASRDEEKSQRQANKLVAFVRDRFDLFHDSNADCYAKDRETGEVSRLNSRYFREKVVAILYKETKGVIRDLAFREALGTLSAVARFEGELQQVNLRIGQSRECYWLDLCIPGSSRAICWNANGWEPIDKPEVSFVRGESMLPLPIPTVGGDIAPLWDIANIPENARLLVVTWLVETLRPDTPFPGLELQGEQGTGKSTTASALRQLCDPNVCNLRGAPKTVEDIYVGAGVNHLVCLENISHLSIGMQDAFCILSTGGGHATRTLYTNKEETVISVRRPYVINGITAAITQQDLLDRTICIECPVIETRQISVAQQQAFEKARPAILGGLLDIACRALAELPTIELDPRERPRLTEFVMLGMAVAKVMGKSPKLFLKQFTEARKESISRVIDSSPVASAIVDMVEARPNGIDATTKDILSVLANYRPDGCDSWPKSPRGLGDALRRVAPALRQLDIECMSQGKGSGGVVRWTIHKKTPAQMSQMSQVPKASAGMLGLGTYGTSPEGFSFDNSDEEDI
jgi:hypothetical protein